MKLDIDCVRDVLIELESFPIGSYTISSFQKSIEIYGTDCVLYTLVKLTEAGYINAKYERALSGHLSIHTVFDITFSGHEFLADIKPKNNWEKLSSAIKQGGGASLKVAANVAIALGTEILKSKLGLTDPPLQDR